MRPSPVLDGAVALEVPEATGDLFPFQVIGQLPQGGRQIPPAKQLERFRGEDLP